MSLNHHIPQSVVNTSVSTPFAKPKSANFRTLLSLIKKLSGFRSRCVICFSFKNLEKAR
jgi:hypothetical protein